MTHIDGDQTQNKIPVTAQIVLRELRQDAAMQSVPRVEDQQLPSDVLQLAAPVERPEQPAEDADNSNHGNGDVPEPDEEEDLLVEEVDRQRTLDDVLMDARLMPHLELTEGDAREPVCLAPVETEEQSFDDVGAIPAVVDCQETVEQVDLSNGIDEVESLDAEVRCDEVVSADTSEYYTAHLGDRLLGSDAAASSVIALGEQVAADMIDDVVHGPLAYLEVQCIATDVSGGHDGVEVNA